MKTIFTILIFGISLSKITAQFDSLKSTKEECKFCYNTEFGVSYTYLKPSPDLNKYSSETQYPLLGFIVTQGVTYRINKKWSLGILANANIPEVTKRRLSPLGVRLRISHYITPDFEYNISAGPRASFKAEAGYDIRTSFSWKDHLGVFFRYEKLPNIINPNPHAYSIGIFTKGKKGLILDCIAQAIGLYSLFKVISSST